MSKTFDPSKPVRTRDGRPARVLETGFSCSDGETIAAVIGDHGNQLVYSYHSDGRWRPGRESAYDLVNVPEKHVRWAVINLNDLGAHEGRQGYAYLYPEKPVNVLQRSGTGRTAIACIRVEFESGEGL